LEIAVASGIIMMRLEAQETFAGDSRLLFGTPTPPRSTEIPLFDE